MSKRILAVLSLCAAATLCSATPLIDEPMKELHLVNGDVLPEAQAKSYNRNSVLVKYRDGAKTVPYEQFPEDCRELVLAKKPKPAPQTSKPAPKEPAVSAAKPVAKRAAPSSRLPEERFNGLAILNTSSEASYSTVELYNDSTDVVELVPSALIGETDSGKTVVGRRWVQVSNGAISGTMKNVQQIQPKSAVTLNVAFHGVAPGASIQSVVWSQ